MLEITKRKAGVFLRLYTNEQTVVSVLISVTVHTRAQKRDSLTMNFTVTNRSINKTGRGRNTHQ